MRAGRLLPHAPCLLCGSDRTGSAALCSACAGDLPRITAACARCGMPALPGNRCACQVAPPPCTTTVAAFRYAFPIAMALHRLKFRGDLVWGAALGELLAGHLAEQPAQPAIDAVIPVPLHPQRLRERGYNQAAELARPLARRLGLPLLANGCERRRATPPQLGLTAAARLANLEGAFQVRDLRGARRVAIVDDVVTTMATASALTKALFDAGATEVHVWCVARAT